VICGGGIVGAATAYYLSTLKGVAPTLVERHEVAGAASGRAGGFLALDWNDGSPVRGGGGARRWGAWL
jgi:glycine/D-amino acid oxidase-like deaminating enzyme